jgi:hypothetical protein
MVNYHNLLPNENNSNFLDWVKEKHRNRIDRGRMRHPVMFSVRKYADERIQEIYKNQTGKKNSSISIFNEEEVSPSSVDKYLFVLDGVYKQVVEKLKVYKQTGKIRYKNFYENYYQPYVRKLDDYYQNVKIEFQQENEKLKLINENRNLSETLNDKNKSYFSRITNNLITKIKSHNNNIVSYILKKSSKDEFEKLFYERELIYWRIRVKNFKNRFTGFWRTAFEIKKNYIIDLNEIKKSRKIYSTYESVPHKFFSIIKYKYLPNLKFNKNFFLKLGFLSMFIFFVKFRFESFDPKILNEYSKNDREVHFILENLETTPGHAKIKKISEIFNEEEDQKYLEVLKKDKELKAMTLEQFESKKDNDEFINDYSTLISSMSARSTIFNMLKIGVPLCYLILKYRKRKTLLDGFNKSRIIFNSLAIYFVLNEIFLSLTFGDYLNLKNFVAVHTFNGDMNELLRLNFYRNNLAYSYLINDKI